MTERWTQGPLNVIKRPTGHACEVCQKLKWDTDHSDFPETSHPCFKAAGLCGNQKKTERVLVLNDGKNFHGLISVKDARGPGGCSRGREGSQRNSLNLANKGFRRRKEELGPETEPAANVCCPGPPARSSPYRLLLPNAPSEPLLPFLPRRQPDNLLSPPTTRSPCLVVKSEAGNWTARRLQGAEREPGGRGKAHIRTDSRGQQAPETQFPYQK